MAIYFVSKDKRARAKVERMENLRVRFSFFSKCSSVSLSERPKVNYIFLKKLGHFLPYSVKSRNRCVLSGRAGSVFRYFRLSRIRLKNLASCGLLTGVRKSSW